jgi:hypothetical protein
VCISRTIHFASVGGCSLGSRGYTQSGSASSRYPYPGYKGCQINVLLHTLSYLFLPGQRIRQPAYKSCPLTAAQTVCKWTTIAGLQSSLGTHVSNRTYFWMELHTPQRSANMLNCHHFFVPTRFNPPRIYSQSLWESCMESSQVCVESAEPSCLSPLALTARE